MTDIRRTCFELRHGCASYTPGHLMHPIHARLLGERPWGWRDGVVSSVAGGDVEVDYVTEDGVGRVPTPDDTSVWAPEKRVAVTDVRTGRAIAVDHLEGGDR